MPTAARSIGQVLAAVKMEFPDVSISKIRFLESEGLLSPDRAPSGYRKYSDADVQRLRYILQMQRDHYLPLKVIREHLDMIDRGLTPPTVDAPTPGVQAPELPEQPAEAPGAVLPEGRPAPKRTVRMSRRELLESSGLPEAMLVELERQLVIQPRRGTVHYGRDALIVAVAARRLAGYGVDARHLRAIKQSAEREVGIVEQAISPYLRRSAGAREVQDEVTLLVVHAHAAFMRQTMNP